MAALRELPKKILLPSAAASLAYVNAKYGIGADAWTLYHAIVISLIYIKKLEKKDRINIFYRLEECALDPKTASNIFLIVPKDDYLPHEKTQWTYTEAYEIILKYAGWLKHKHNVQKGEMIAMDFTNRPQFIWVWFGLWALGATPAFINHNLRDKSFVHSVRVSQARLLLVDPEVSEVLTEETREGLGPDEKGRAVETVVLESETQAEIMAQTAFRPPDEARSGATQISLAMLIYTSGTTGLPKAGVVAWGKAYAGVRYFSTALGIKTEDIYLTALPLYHSSGSVLGVLQVLDTAATVVVLPKFSARNFMRHVHENKVTGFQYIGEMCRYLVSSPPSQYDRAHNVRFAFGNGMRLDVWQVLKDRFNVGTILEFYGATEGTAASAVYSKNSFLRGAVGRQGLIMRTLLNTFIIVQHDHTTDEPYRDPKTGFCVKVKTGQPGELIHPLDPNAIEEKYMGYYGNEKASMAKILRNVFKKGDAYYRTGDMEKRDEDGRLWFVDRVGDTFRWKSENVSTAEVAEAIGTHPKVDEANVYGVQLPNHDGRAGCAAIVLSSNSTIDDALARDLVDHTRKRLPRYAVPLFLRVRKHVDVTGTLKHQKVALRNEGVDPANLGDDEVYWLEPGADRYTWFDQKDWKRIVGGEAKL